MSQTEPRLEQFVSLSCCFYGYRLVTYVWCSVHLLNDRQKTWFHIDRTACCLPMIKILFISTLNFQWKLTKSDLNPNIIFVWTQFDPSGTGGYYNRWIRVRYPPSNGKGWMADSDCVLTFYVDTHGTSCKFGTSPFILDLYSWTEQNTAKNR